jgi:hypothetical protein
MYWMSNRIFSISLHLQDEKGNFRDAPSVPLIAVSVLQSKSECVT